MKYYTSGNATVDAISEMNFAGNVIPHNWYNAIKNDETGKPDAIGILILAEIVYWHRGTIEKDERTGQVIGLKKRFKADLLQRSYDSFADQMGFTKRQVRDAFKRLEDMGFIKRHFRTIDAGGMKLSNVLFIEVISRRIHDATFFSVPYDEKTSYPIQNNVTGPALNVDTYTENTTKTTTEDKKTIRPQQAADRKLPNQKDEEVLLIFEHFLQKEIINHQKLTGPMKTAVKARLKDYSFEQLIQVIDNYSTVYKSDDYWFSYKYSFADLMRDKDVRKFIDDADPLTNYATDKAAAAAGANGTQQPQRSRKKFESAY